MNSLLKKNNLFYKLLKNRYGFILQIALLLLLINTTINVQEKYTNSLIHEDSPYLQQHAHNPVNWNAWGEVAFEKAKKENKMIFLSIGYSTCHWCHVMEEESFENEEVAAILNKHFISIKVDREEMPHVDKYYQDVHNLINKRGGGWPLTIVLTPERKAFFAATYIPVERKYGRMGIKDLLNQLQLGFKTDKKRMDEVANNIEKLLKENRSSSFEKRDLNIEVVNQFVKEVNDSFDYTYYGIGDKPKFPHASTAQTLLDIYTVYKNEKALELATKMLKAMANGGIYDQIEGGFYRYSVDEQWQIPHFEKMLYTNAELLSAYSTAYALTKDNFYKNIVEGIISFTQERFEKENLLYSASDADSLLGERKEEGAYFVFSTDEIKEHLIEKKYTDAQIDEVLDYFNISFEGNFENGLNNPYLTNKKVPQNIKTTKVDLKELRSQKTYPFIDNKILTSWNAMYISALFDAKSVNVQNSQKAQKLLDTLLEKLYVNEVLYHQRLVDKTPKVKALFEDYAFLIDAVLKAYDFSLDKKYLNLASKFSTEAVNKFYTNKNWLMSDDEFKSPAGVYDSSYKSSLSVMVDNLLKVALLTDNLELQELAKESFSNNSLILSSRPSSSAWLLRAYMGYKKEYIVLKAPKEMLENKEYINYPFLLKKVNSDRKYLACKVGLCFSFGDDFKTIMNAIKKEIKN